MSKSARVSDSLDLPCVVEVGGELRPGHVARVFEQHRELIDDLLLRIGAVLLKGLHIDSVELFDRFLSEACLVRESYTDGNSPRTEVASRVYTSTEYPPEYFISLHNEKSYSNAWPRRLAFCCHVAPDRGGETPLADGRRVLKAMPVSIVEEFTRKGLRYIRNLHGGFGPGPSWQQTFETSEKLRVEEYCKRAGIQAIWREDDGLRVIQERPAVLSHPVTAEDVWFNQADQFHVSTHPKEVQDSMLALYGSMEMELPQHVCFADGTAIDPAMLDEVRSVVRGLMHVRRWDAGEVLLIDNVLVMHGRMPYSGRRKVLAALCS